MIKPIKSNKHYEDALARIYTLMQKDIKPASKESDELEVLSIFVKEYEQKHLPISYSTLPTSASQITS